MLGVFAHAHFRLAGLAEKRPHQHQAGADAPAERQQAVGRAAQPGWFRPSAGCRVEKPPAQCAALRPGLPGRSIAFIQRVLEGCQGGKPMLLCGW